MTLIGDDNSSIYYSCDEDEEKCFQSADDRCPFDIILVDIQKTAEEERVCCEKIKLLGAQAVNFIALSYRWGELDEQVTPVTDDYCARIISFDLNDFFRLCWRILNEPDLKDIKYAWVDAICVDQGNDRRKKATIYRMTDIYKNATYIVAVPDLHMRSLIAIRDLNARMRKQIQKYRWYLYHFIHGNTQELCRLDNDWRNKLHSASDGARQGYNERMQLGWVSETIGDCIGVVYFYFILLTTIR
ncbi:uncharacterized protein BX664DRAFT_320921 [Halteromyces radiatus]|uniref:uncharacterized protein n=1 Tax=Halteromyces radiatus TaxID=101107 RepID=UPI002220C170|nr:uncharacterized protein BX664DRAFT_320921 [Halteromyces radiatus]KAI8099285.1 hypothetical protein BX664DRAFT_320921 [Halteromyces radiatus]